MRLAFPKFEVIHYLLQRWGHKFFTDQLKVDDKKRRFASVTDDQAAPLAAQLVAELCDVFTVFRGPRPRLKLTLKEHPEEVFYPRWKQLHRLGGFWVEITHLLNIPGVERHLLVWARPQVQMPLRMMVQNLIFCSSEKAFCLNTDTSVIPLGSNERFVVVSSQRPQLSQYFIWHSTAGVLKKAAPLCETSSSCDGDRGLPLRILCTSRKGEGLGHLCPRPEASHSLEENLLLFEVSAGESRNFVIVTTNYSYGCDSPPMIWGLTVSRDAKGEVTFLPYDPGVKYRAALYLPNSKTGRTIEGELEVIEV